MAAKACIYKPNEHADEYMVFIEDTKEVSGASTLVYTPVSPRSQGDVPSVHVWQYIVDLLIS